MHPVNEKIQEMLLERKLEKLTPQELIKFLGLDKEYINGTSKDNR
jgi:hypothetical protein